MIPPLDILHSARQVSPGLRSPSSHPWLYCFRFFPSPPSPLCPRFPQTPEAGVVESRYLCDMDKPYDISGPVGLRVAAGQCTALFEETSSILSSAFISPGPLGSAVSPS